jgi:hypothetical protein
MPESSRHDLHGILEAVSEAHPCAIHKLRFSSRRDYIYFHHLDNCALCVGDLKLVRAGKDPALFSRMSGFHIYNSEQLDFSRHQFQIGPDKTEAVEGRAKNRRVELVAQ